MSNDVSSPRPQLRTRISRVFTKNPGSSEEPSKEKKDKDEKKDKEKKEKDEKKDKEDKKDKKDKEKRNKKAEDAKEPKEEGDGKIKLPVLTRDPSAREGSGDRKSSEGSSSAASTSSSPTFVAPINEAPILQSSALKKGVVNQAFKKRWMALYSDRLDFYHDEKEVGKDKPRATIRLATAKHIRHLPRAPGSKVEDCIEVYTAERTFVFQPLSESISFQQWMKALVDVHKKLVSDNVVIVNPAAEVPEDKSDPDKRRIGIARQRTNEKSDGEAPRTPPAMKRAHSKKEISKMISSPLVEKTSKTDADIQSPPSGLSPLPGKVKAPKKDKVDGEAKKSSGSSETKASKELQPKESSSLAPSEPVDAKAVSKLEQRDSKPPLSPSDPIPLPLNDAKLPLRNAALSLSQFSNLPPLPTLPPPLLEKTDPLKTPTSERAIEAPVTPSSSSLSTKPSTPPPTQLSNSPTFQSTGPSISSARRSSDYNTSRAFIGNRAVPSTLGSDAPKSGSSPDQHSPDSKSAPLRSSGPATPVSPPHSSRQENDFSMRRATTADNKSNSTEPASGKVILGSRPAAITSPRPLPTSTSPRPLPTPGAQPGVLMRTSDFIITTSDGIEVPVPAPVPDRERVTSSPLSSTRQMKPSSSSSSLNPASIANGTAEAQKPIEQFLGAAGSPRRLQTTQSSNQIQPSKAAPVQDSTLPAIKTQAVDPTTESKHQFVPAPVSPRGTNPDGSLSPKKLIGKRVSSENVLLGSTSKLPASSMKTSPIKEEIENSSLVVDPSRTTQVLTWGLCPDETHAAMTVHGRCVARWKKSKKWGLVRGEAPLDPGLGCRLFFEIQISQTSWGSRLKVGFCSDDVDVTEAPKPYHLIQPLFFGTWLLSDLPPPQDEKDVIGISIDFNAQKVVIFKNYEFVRNFTFKDFSEPPTTKRLYPFFAILGDVHIRVTREPKWKKYPKDLVLSPNFVIPIPKQHFEYKTETLSDFFDSIGVSAYKTEILDYIASTQISSNPPAPVATRSAVSGNFNTLSNSGNYSNLTTISENSPPAATTNPLSGSASSLTGSGNTLTVSGNTSKWNSTTPHLRSKPGRAPLLTRSQTQKEKPPITLEDLTVDIMEELFLPFHVQNFIWKCRNEMMSYVDLSNK